MLILFALLVVLYLLVTFATPTNPDILELYRMDNLEYQSMRATIAIPLIAMWFTALYGFVSLRQYAKAIQKSPDGRGFQWVAAGLGVLALGLPINSIIGTMLSRSAGEGLLEQSTQTIIATHLTVGYQLLSFALLAYGAFKLLKVVHKIKIPYRDSVIGVLMLATISVVYLLSVLNNPSREIAVPPNNAATYYMNDFLIITTIVLPYIAAWACGVFAFVAIRTYQKNVDGVLYRKALQKLNFGILYIISVSALMQFSNAAVTTYFSWQLGSLAALVQVLVIAIGVGFVYVAVGSKDLAKLEEVK